MMLGMVDARLIRMLMGVQLVAMRDMRMVRGLFMVAGFVMAGRFVVVLGGLFVVLGGLAMMFSAFVSCRHIHVLREVITLRGQPAGVFMQNPPADPALYTRRHESPVDKYICNNFSHVNLYSIESNTSKNIVLYL